MSQLIRNMTEITRCGVQYRTETLAPLELKACHASYLREICAEPGISQDKLAARICINKSNVARQAAALEEGGFITRIPSPEDKRVMGLYPTEKTIALLPRMNAILDEWETCLTEGIPAEELEVAKRVLERMKTKASIWLEEH
jgi:DNA-binding MarR family transcriptional regulator